MTGSELVGPLPAITFNDWGNLADRRLLDNDDDLRWRLINGDGPHACQCLGCQLARATHLYIATDEHGVVIPDTPERYR